MSKLLSYLVLPREITAFERSYLGKLNRVALLFFCLHVPAFAFIAWLAGNSPVEALVMTPLVLIGPVIVYLRAENPRAVAIASGFTAMVMGGLLVHFGRGAMQIEMHFYFFVLLALLAVFANPLAILTAAGTVAVHHLVLWLVLPTSVFNYDASVWTVVVHALFVVLESVAAVFVARSFFDNVIGLERIVEARTGELAARTRDMRLVLDSVGQGFVMVDQHGRMSVERSAILDRWLGTAPTDVELFASLARQAPDFAERLRVSWPEVFADILPLELTLEQLPRRVAVDGRHLRFDYTPVGGTAVPDQILVVVSDVTAEVEREQADLVRRELLAVFERFGKDRAGFLEFYEEAEALVTSIAKGDVADPELARKLHTLKGNAALFGVESIAIYCQDLEARFVAEGVAPTASERQDLRALWVAFTNRLDTLLGAHDVRTINVSEEELGRVIEALRGGTPASDVAATLSAWRLEPIELRFARVAEQANRLARRLGKEVEVDIRGNGVRLDPRQWTGFWAAFVHAVRNAVDHGVEESDERVARGKPPVARIELAARAGADGVVLEIRDDGRGVDWDKVRTKAQAAGLPHASDSELVEALFADGFSTRGEVGALSGRGVGLAALRAAAADRGGRIALESERGRGTRLVLSFPVPRRETLPPPMRQRPSVAIVR